MLEKVLDEFNPATETRPIQVVKLGSDVLIFRLHDIDEFDPFQRSLNLVLQYEVS